MQVKLKLFNFKSKEFTFLPEKIFISRFNSQIHMMHFYRTNLESIQIPNFNILLKEHFIIQLQSWESPILHHATTWNAKFLSFLLAFVSNVGNHRYPQKLHSNSHLHAFYQPVEVKWKRCGGKGNCVARKLSWPNSGLVEKTSSLNVVFLFNPNFSKFPVRQLKPERIIKPIQFQPQSLSPQFVWH